MLDAADASAWFRRALFALLWRAARSWESPTLFWRSHRSKMQSGTHACNGRFHLDDARTVNFCCILMISKQLSFIFHAKNYYFYWDFGNMPLLILFKIVLSMRIRHTSHLINSLKSAAPIKYFKNAFFLLKHIYTEVISYFYCGTYNEIIK